MNKIKEYQARHRLPEHGTVRTLFGVEWTAKPGGTHWHTREIGGTALSTAQLVERHGPLMLIP